jgi:FkbH-like protein
MSTGSSTAPANEELGSKVKCLTWDLDNTLWDGVLLEDPGVRLKPRALEVIRTLDERGILHSIASRNDSDAAREKLRHFGLVDYFLYPQINWNPKSASIQEIANALRIGLDSFAFVDDDPFERSEVSFAHPEVFCIDAANLDAIPAMKRMQPKFVTEESKFRRLMYLADRRRHEIERDFTGTNDEFLATLGMVLTISKVDSESLKRAEELTVRTHQLNTTGYAYSYEELDELRRAPDRLLLIAALEDTYGTYGKIGLSLVETAEEGWTIKLLLMSCRVISRGVGTVMLTHIMNLAKKAGVRLRAEFVPNERNRIMYITYKFAGFREVKNNRSVMVLESDLSRMQAFPPYIQVRVE